jgi:hypothetical protein
MAHGNKETETEKLICAYAKYKDKRYRKKSGILKADFIDLFINYS